MSTPNNFGPAPFRQAPLDAKGSGFSKPWILFFERLFGAGVTTTEISNTISGGGMLTGFDDVNARHVRLQTNGTDNGSQSQLDLAQGYGVKLADDGAGNVAASAGFPGIFRLGSLIGAFADSGGNVIEVVYIGNAAILAVPVGATQLQLGVNDAEGVYHDNTGSWTIAVDGTNYTVAGNTMPWLQTGGRNPDYPFGGDNGADGAAPVVIAASSESPVAVRYVSGTVDIGSGLNVDASGGANTVATQLGTPAHWALSPPPSSTPGQNVGAIRTVTAATTLTGSDLTLLCDCTSAAFTVTLPATPAGGTIYNVKKIDATANALTIAGTIEGLTNAVLTTPGTSLEMQFDGSAWRVI